MNLAERQLMGGGYDKLNFATIAKELNTTRANLHYHFKNKETLAIEVTKQFRIRNCNEFTALRETFKGDFFGFIDAVDNSFWNEDYGVDSAGACACSMLITDPELPEPLVKLSQEFYQEIEFILVQAIQDAIDYGEIRSDINVKREAMRVHVIMMGIMTSAHHISNLTQAKAQLGGLIADWGNSLR